MSAISDLTEVVEIDLITFSIGLEDTRILSRIADDVLLNVYIDNSYVRRLPKYAEELKNSNMNIYECRNHSKICLFGLKNGEKIVLLTSANLNNNIRLEFITFEKNKDLYDYIKQKAEQIKKSIPLDRLIEDESDFSLDSEFDLDSF